MEETKETKIKRIELSLAACRILRPVYINPFTTQRDDFANKILQTMKK